MSEIRCDSCKYGKRGNLGSEQPGYIWSRWSCSLMPDRSKWVLKLDWWLFNGTPEEADFDREACPLISGKASMIDNMNVKQEEVHYNIKKKGG